MQSTKDTDDRFGKRVQFFTEDGELLLDLRSDQAAWLTAKANECGMTPEAWILHMAITTGGMPE